MPNRGKHNRRRGAATAFLAARGCTHPAAARGPRRPQETPPDPLHAPSQRRRLPGALTAFLGVLTRPPRTPHSPNSTPPSTRRCACAPTCCPSRARCTFSATTPRTAPARLAGVEAPRYEDNETTIDELKARIEKTLAFIGSTQGDRGRGGPRDRLPHRPEHEGEDDGRDYLLHFVLPNYYFHLTTAYDLLRYAGVDIGKRDFLGRCRA